MSFLLALTGGFASGVFLRSLLVSGWTWIAFALLLAALLAGAALLAPRRAYALGALFLCCAALGMVRSAIADTPLPQPFSSEVKQRVSYDGVVTGDPDLRDSTERIPVRVSHAGQSATLLAVVPRTTATAVGDRVHVAGTLALPEPFASDGGRTFRYDRFLEKDGIRFLLNYASLSVTRPAPWYSVPAAFSRVKHWFLDGLAAALPEPYASLAGGIVVGGKSGLGTELENAFVLSGLVQLIVLSGYNVMVVADWMMALIAALRLSRRAQAVAGALAVTAFVLVAGASSTALRAALMALIALYARATGRSYAAGRALLLAVFLMLLLNPLYLAFDPGFGLSVLATAGLIALTPHIAARLSFVTSAFWKEAWATTLAAQLGVLPLLLYDTGNLSLVAIPANLAVMPVMPAAMGLAALAGFAGALLPQTAALFLALPSYYATAYVIAVARLSAALPFARIIVPAFPFILVLAAYAAVAYFAASKRFSTTLQFTFSRKAST